MDVATTSKPRVMDYGCCFKSDSEQASDLPPGSTSTGSALLLHCFTTCIALQKSELTCKHAYEKNSSVKWLWVAFELNWHFSGAVQNSKILSVALSLETCLWISVKDTPLFPNPYSCPSRRRGVSSTDIHIHSNCTLNLIHLLLGLPTKGCIPELL